MRFQFSMPNGSTRYRPAFKKSVLVHIAVIVVLVWSTAGMSPAPIVHKSNKIVHAVAVDSTEIEKNVEKIKALEQKKKQDEINHQKQLVAMEQKAKADQAKAKKAAAAAKAKVAALQKQQAEAKQQLAKTQAAQAAAQKKLAETKKLTAQQSQALQLEQKIAAEQAKERQQRSEAIEGEVNKYQGLILEAISAQWLVPPGTDKNAQCTLGIKLAPGGAVLDVAIVKGSGNNLLDRSAEAAVYKASPLPVPTTSDAFEPFRQFNLVVKPEHFI